MSQIESRTFTWLLVLSSIELSFGIPIESGQEVRTSFELVETVLTLNEPVFVKFSVQNGLSEMVRFDLGANREQEFHFTVSDPSGMTSEVLRPTPQGIARIGKIELGPGESHSQRNLLTKLYSFDQPGTYAIVPELTAAIVTESGERIVPEKGRQLTLTVLPRDESRLRQVCGRLAAEAISGPGALAAGETLSFIRDSVAVEYLAEVLQKSSRAEHLAVEGLTKIQNKEAVKALIDALNDPTVLSQDPIMKTLLESRLRAIANSISDPEVRRMIKEALN